MSIVRKTMLAGFTTALLGAGLLAQGGAAFAADTTDGHGNVGNVGDVHPVVPGNVCGNNGLGADRITPNVPAIGGDSRNDEASADRECGRGANNDAS